MSTLNGKQINNTYNGLIKTSDEGAIDGTLKNLQDGEGNNLPLQVSNTGVNFTGTVTGIPAGAQGPQGPQGVEGPQGVAGPQGADGTGTVQTIVAGTNVTVDDTDPANPIVSAAGGGGAAGLVSGGFTNSMVSASTLTTLPATAIGVGDIVLGENARIINVASTNTRPWSGKSIVIGDNASTQKVTDYSFITAYGGGISIGNNSIAKLDASYGPVAIGNFAQAKGRSVSIGSGTSLSNSSFSTSGGVAIGYSARSTGSGESISIGYQSTASAYHSVALGNNAQSTAGSFNTSGTAIGTQSHAKAESAIAVGNNAKVSNSTSVGGIAIGTGTTIEAGIVDAVAIGRGVAAGIAGTVSIKELETQTVGGGVTMYSPNGTGYKVTVTDGGLLTVTAI